MKTRVTLGENRWGTYGRELTSMFTQNRDSIYRADLDTTLYLPTLEEVDRTGVLSWLRYHVRLEDEDRELTNTFSIMHTITSWAGTNNLTPYYPPPTFTDQANAVRSFLSMEYQMYSIPPLPGPVDNSPDFFLVNCYPFRQVGITYQDTLPYEPTLGGELESWLLEHFEEGMDSTFITAWEFGLDQNREVSVLFNPQAFGRAGGEDMWTWDDTLSQYFVDYGSYNYRIPTPQEFLMSCNTALLRQAKGFSPHCLVSYCEASASEAGLLDQNNIPFDAPYEEWVYRDRPTDDFYFIPPDSYPPFIDSPYDFDPLYDLPGRPVDIVGWERNRENYLLWKFEPYARLWNSMRSTLGEIASVAPELSALRWWEGYEEEASIEHPGSLPIIYTTPEIRVFTDSTESICYLFYVNRQCRQATTNYTISADEGDLPEDALTTLVLDHSRRFIIPVEEDDGIYSFLDTLEAGQGRLVEFVNTPLAADIRITAPDVMARYPRTPADIRNFEFKAGDTILIIADFFNMGTSSENNVIVSCIDLSNGSAEIGRDTLNFGGLSTSGWTTDSDKAIFKWEIESDDIGVHMMEISTISSISGEPDTLDNGTTAVFLIEPGDYATTVLHNPWDMTEAVSSPPDWYTNDIDSLLGYSSFTDSVSGMFEGTIPDPGSTNRLYLHIPHKPSSEWLQGTFYNQLCFAGRTGRDSFLTVGWTDSTGTADSVTFNSSTDTLTAEWNEYGPFDFSSNFPVSKIKELWLRFDPISGNLFMPVRIGWIRLTE